MMKWGCITLLTLVTSFCHSCDLLNAGSGVVGLPIETRFAFINLSTQFYASLDVRQVTTGGDALYTKSPLLAPGAIHRVDFRELVGTGCPRSIDLRIFLYRRINQDIPIGLDSGEPMEAAPMAAGEVLNLPVCSVETLVAYTVVNWDAADGTARLKIAQGTAVDRDREIIGVDPMLAGEAPPMLALSQPIAGRVTLVDGSGVSGVGVLLRTRFRVRLDDADPTNDPDAGFSEPIAFTLTDSTGAFSFDRPAGAYQVEFFSDDFSFRPATLLLETPISVIQTIAEPL